MGGSERSRSLEPLEAREEWQREYAGCQESVLINRSNPWARNGELDGQRNPPNEVLYVGEGVALEGQEARMAIRQWFSGVSRASVKRKSED